MTRRQRVIVAAAAVVAALSRFAALSKTPWDWDEVLFCLSLRGYDVGAHHPHPPGFPLYVGLAKIARLIADTDFHALQSVNVIAGMLVFPVVFWLARSFRFDFHGSLAAAVLFAFLPNVWYYGGTAFSDVPAMLLYMAAIAAYMSAGMGARGYLAASVLLAAGMLIRPQNATVAAFPWTLATVRMLRARRLGAVIGCTLLVVALVAIGYGAAASITGFDAYVESVRNHSKFVKESDTFHSPGRPPLWRVLLMQLDPFQAGKAAIALNLLALVAVIRGQRNRVLEILLTFAPFFVFALFTVNPAGSSRFSLNYIAGMVLLAVEGAAVIGRFAGERLGTPHLGAAVRGALIGSLFVRLATWAIPALEVPRTTTAPPVAAAMWIEDHVHPSVPVFVDESIWPWVRYFAPSHPQVRHRQTMNLLGSPEAAHGWFVANYPTKAREAIVFVRPQTRIANLVVRRSFEAFVQPAATVVHFGAGWHGVEGDSWNWWRWSERLSFIVLGPIRGKAELWLKFDVPIQDMKQPVDVTFSLNGQRLATVPIVKSANEVRFEVEPRADAPNLLRIDVSDAFVPSAKGSHDSRELALMLRDWNWRKL